MDLSAQLLLVAVVLGGMLAGLFFLKRAGWVTTTLARTAGGSGRVRELRVIERVAVSAQHTLVLVEVNHTRMLVCLSPAASNVTILGGDQQS